MTQVLCQIIQLFSVQFVVDLGEGGREEYLHLAKRDREGTRGEQRGRGLVQEAEGGRGQQGAAHGAVCADGDGQAPGQQHKVLLLRAGQRLGLTPQQPPGQGK